MLYVSHIITHLNNRLCTSHQALAISWDSIFEATKIEVYYRYLSHLIMCSKQTYENTKCMRGERRGEEKRASNFIVSITD